MRMSHRHKRLKSTTVVSLFDNFINSMFVFNFFFFLIKHLFFGLSFSLDLLQRWADSGGDRGV